MSDLLLLIAKYESELFELDKVVYKYNYTIDRKERKGLSVDREEKHIKVHEVKRLQLYKVVNDLKEIVGVEA
jgi:hypothetical protein